MSKISNLDYAALNLPGDNYLHWALDTKIDLWSKELGDAIIEGNNETDTNQYRAISIIRHHLIEGLKDQYLTMENSLDLWTALQRRYDHQKTVLLPKAKHVWKNLRFMDYKSVDEYNSILFKIVSMMRLCGEEVTEKELLDKTFSTFHSTNVLLQQQYRKRGFASYTDLISCLLLAEANNELLMKNSEMGPIGTTTLPEANEAEKKDPKDYGRGRGSYGRGRGGISKPSNSTKSACHRCRMSNHWAKNCRTPKHLCELYQENLKNKNPEAHMVHDTGYDADVDSDLEKDDLLDFETSDCLKD
ncbi:uncharacterized protein LOC125590510 [Brassica napus]|uniref:uncharacterized protein LOC125590510 n=1 Tax=Brassica napus TaxID=3708 RepID=UPI00207B0B48|nr:uncharacterized protein LOC125590510 [Brassica napus]